MKKVNFEGFADNYSEILEKQLGFFEADADYFALHKVSILKQLMDRKPSRILDFGCGVGTSIKHLLTTFPEASITGCDIAKKCL